VLNFHFCCSVLINRWYQLSYHVKFGGALKRAPKRKEKECERRVLLEKYITIIEIEIILVARLSFPFNDKCKLVSKRKPAKPLFVLCALVLLLFPNTD
jgi:prolipoprotein diacylglyceryltransferase